MDLYTEIDPNTPIEYKYLNIDKEKFYKTEQELVMSVGKGGTVRVIPNWEYNQALYAASRRYFTEVEAIMTCRNLNGLGIKYGK